MKIKTIDSRSPAYIRAEAKVKIIIDDAKKESSDNFGCISYASITSYLKFHLIETLIKLEQK